MSLGSLIYIKLFRLLAVIYTSGNQMDQAVFFNHQAAGQHQSMKHLLPGHTVAINYLQSFVKV